MSSHTANTNMKNNKTNNYNKEANRNAQRKYYVKNRDKVLQYKYGTQFYDILGKDLVKEICEKYDADTAKIVLQLKRAEYKMVQKSIPMPVSIMVN